MSPADKARFTVKKITEVEGEVLDAPLENAHPVFFAEPQFELRWYNKPDSLAGRFQVGFSAKNRFLYKIF